MSLWNIKKIKFSIILATLGVLTFGFVCTGMATHASMHGTSMNSNGIIMSDANQQECCNTSISKNIDTWKNIVLTVPDKMRDALALLAFGLVLGYGLLSAWNRRPSMEPDVGRLRLYIKQNPDLILFNHLRLAFARGILNTKVY